VPTLLRIGPHRFHFHSREHDPPHVHVSSPGKEAVFNLDPVVEEGSTGYTRRDLRRIETVVRAHGEEFLRRWHEYFGP